MFCINARVDSLWQQNNDCLSVNYVASNIKLNKFKSSRQRITR